MSQPFATCKHAFSPTNNIKNYLQVYTKLEDMIKTCCNATLTSATACVKVAPFQYSMYLSAKIPQSYLEDHNIWIIIHIHQSSNTF